MTRINTNISSLRGVRTLGKSNKLLDTSLARLSTGLQINAGRDNPSGLIASETLRSQLTVIEQSIKNSNRANNVLATADSALGEVTGLLNQVRGLIQEGLNDGALSQSEIEANQLQIDAALSAINRISANTSFAGDKLIDGSKSFQTTSTTADAAKFSDFQINQAVFAGGSGTILVDANITTAATKAQLFADGRNGGLANDTVIEVSGAKGTDVLFLGATSSLSNIETAVNTLTETTGVEATRTAAVAAETRISLNDANSTLTFTDKRVTASADGATSDANLKDIKVQLVDGGAAKAALSLGVTETANAINIRVDLAIGTDGSTVLTTASDVETAINGNTTANAAVTVVAGGTGASSVSDGALAQFTVGSVAGNGSAQSAVDAYLTFTSEQFGSDQFVGINVLQGSLDTLDAAGTGNAASRDEGTDVVATINGQQAQGKGLEASVATAQLDTSLTFTEAANTDGNNAKLTITGGGSLFQIGQDVSTAGQIGIGIEAVNTARLGGVTGKLYEIGSSGGKSLLDVSPTVPGADLADIVNEALDRVTSLRGRIGAVQKNIIDTNTATLGVALENIAEARSQIIDTDFASETANLTRAQILSQSGLSVLSIANQNPSQVLSLLG